MKKQFLLTLLAAVMLTACGQKSTPEQSAQTETQTAAVENDYGHMDPVQAENNQRPAEDLSGKIISLTASEFLDRITDIDPAKGFRYKGATPCMVDFYADWCGPCRQLSPVVERLAAKYKGQLIIYKVNVDKAQDVCSALGIQSIPTLFFFKPNAQPGKIVGAPSESELDQLIQEFLK